MSKAGKTPISVKQAASEYDFGHDDLDYSIFKIDPQLQEELNKKGLVARWINARTYTQGGNFHRSGWQAYRRTTGSDRSSADFAMGVSPEGFIVRNDLILAVKPKDVQERWAKKIRARTEAQNGASANRGRELKESAERAGVNIKVHEGYEEND